jgi:hypothetical protein
MMAQVGFSTGCLYKLDIPLEQRIKIYHNMGADAIEISLATAPELLAFELTEEVESDIRKYDYVTFHTPWKGGIRYNPKDSKEVIAKLQELNDRLPIEGMVIHPNTIDYFSYMEDTGLPFRLENMDLRKSFGTHPEHFEELVKNYDFDYIIDVQHIYEHDHTMKLADEFIELFGDKLKHFHVSGCRPGELHVPTHLGDNKDQIVQVLEKRIALPKIIEGMRETTEDLAAEELDFIRQYEK